MANELEQFEELDTQVGAEDSAEKKEKGKGNKEKDRMLKEMFKETLKNDAAFEERHKIWSDSVQVVNTLGFGASGGLVEDKTAKDKRTLVGTSVIVGYTVLNCGNDPIPYQTEEFVEDETGKFVGQVVDKVLNPGEKAYLSRKYMTLFCASKEISFQLANGILVTGQKGKDDGEDIDAQLRRYYFRFSDKSIKVNDSEVKINIGEKVKDEAGNDKWIVKEEFVTAFGNLNNGVESTKTGGQTKTKYNKHDLAANYVRCLMEQQGVM